MLENKSRSLSKFINSLLVFKLSSSEEIVAQLTEVGDDHVVVKQPCRIVQSAEGYGLSPALMMADHDESFVIYKNGIAGYAEPLKGVEEGYREFHSEIAVPAEKKLIL